MTIEEEIMKRYNKMAKELLIITLVIIAIGIISGFYLGLIKGKMIERKKVNYQWVKELSDRGLVDAKNGRIIKWREKWLVKLNK